MNWAESLSSSVKICSTSHNKAFSLPSPEYINNKNNPIISPTTVCSNNSNYNDKHTTNNNTKILKRTSPEFVELFAKPCTAKSEHTEPSYNLIERRPYA